MTVCKYLDNCTFIEQKMKHMPNVADLMKQEYCHSHYEHCARYQVASNRGTKYVPTDLFPNEMEGAKRLIEQTG